MDLVTTSSPTSEVSKCLSSVRVALSADCQVVVSAPSAGGSFVPALWANAAAPTYTQLKECPVTAGDAVPAASDSASDVLAAIQTALNQHIYGSGKSSGLTGIAATAGVVSFTGYTYAVKASTVSVTGVVVADGTGLSDPQIAASVGVACTAGRFGVIVGDIKLCPLCPAGTTGDGNGCTACDAGTASGTVGATTCATTCAAGTYSSDGYSNCLPCAAGTYRATSDPANQCKECPTDSNSWLPGSTGCVRCVAGIPKCVAGEMDGEQCGTQSASSPGYHILSLAKIASCDLAGSYALPAYGQCASWRTDSVTLQLALTVAGDCSITIRPITDTSCAKEGAVDGGNDPGAPTVSPANTYTYADLVMRAYYATTKTVRSVLSANSDGVSGVLLAIDQNTGGTALDFRFWGATTLASASTTPTTVSESCAGQCMDAPDSCNFGRRPVCRNKPQLIPPPPTPPHPTHPPPQTVCAGTVTAIGGQVAQLPSTPVSDASCPSGSYAISGQFCAAW